MVLDNAINILYTTLIDSEHRERLTNMTRNTLKRLEEIKDTKNLIRRCEYDLDAREILLHGAKDIKEAEYQAEKYAQLNHLIQTLYLELYDMQARIFIQTCKW